MNTPRDLFNGFLTFVAIACIAIVAGAYSCSSHASRAGTNIQVNGTDAYCDGYSTATSSGITTLTCIPTGGGGPGAPSGCSALINLSTIASLTSAGGSVNLTSSCSTPASGITYNWSRNGILGASSVANWIDTLPANSTTSVVSYTYQVRACAGTSCTTFPATPLQANVAGTSGGSWSGTCPGFTTTHVSTFNWASPTRLYSGGFDSNDVWVIQFTTGNVSTSSSLPRIAAAEYTSPPQTRKAVLSATPCDFSTQATAGATSISNSVTLVFALGTGTGFGYYPVLQLNRTYYVNIKNESPSCGSVCDMFADLIGVGGL